jgi:hypothetical protein
VNRLKILRRETLGNQGKGAYELLSPEYYDAEAHPTCHNLNRLSRVFLARHLAEPWCGGSVLEVGSGSSSVASILHSRGYSLEGLTISDDSEGMIAHSSQWESLGAAFLLCSASAIPVEDSGFSLLVAGLGDPYNEPRFWCEAHRVMLPAAKILFTMPSFDWALRFRGPEDGARFGAAEFVLRDGRAVDLPSFIPRLENQIAMIQKAGFAVLSFEALGVEALGAGERLSPKIEVFPNGWSSIVWGFKAVRVD